MAGAGVGEQIFDTGDLSLSFEEGITYTSETFTNATPTNEFLGGSLAYHVKGKLMEGLTAFSDATYNQSLEKLQDSLIQGQIGIRASLTKAMFAEAKYELSYDNSPAIGAERLDVRYILAIGWSF